MAMTYSIGPPPAVRTQRLLAATGACCVLLLSWPLPTRSATDEPKRTFNLPAGPAEESLKLFSAQASCGVIFSTDGVKGARTSAVQGEMSNREAILRMVSGTALVVTQDKKSGGFAVRRKPAANSRETGKSSVDRPAENEAKSDSMAAQQDDSKSSLKKKTNPMSNTVLVNKTETEGMTTTNRSRPEPVKSNNLVSRLAAIVAFVVGGSASAQNAPPATGSNTNSVQQDEAIVLSPFEVQASGDRGYYGANTMSGTRFNSRIEDLAASISVVTKEQMADFALLDIHDIFNYEASTEGMGNFSDVTDNSFGDPVDNMLLNPNNANRIRGIGPANQAFGNFATSGRVPLDPSDMDAVEISRGPNANIFGLGETAGTVNAVPASANTRQNKAQVQFRVDSYGGNRSSIDVNRVLKKDVLAVRGSLVYQHDGFIRKPSGTDTFRANGMIRYQPFKRTSITASTSSYRMTGVRANNVPPRDAISYWRDSGRPAWDPVTSTVYVNGTSFFAPGAGVGTATGNTPWFTNHPMLNNGGGSSFLRIYPDGTAWATPTLAVANPALGPLSAKVAANHYFITNPENFRNTQPLMQASLSITDKSDYDWSKYNTAASNWQMEKTVKSLVRAEHFFLDTRRQTLGVQAAWYGEDSESYQRFVSGVPGDSGTSVARANSNYLYIDPNMRLMDGRPNPDFGRPFIGSTSPLFLRQPLRSDSYRGQLAYRLDLSGEKNLLRWLGSHQVSGYQEYSQRIRRRFQFRDAIVSDHTWLPAGAPRGTQAYTPPPGSPPYNQRSDTHTRAWYQFYVGDSRGAGFDHAPGIFRPGVYDYVWSNAATGQTITEKVEWNEAADIRATGGLNNLKNVLRTRGAVLQSRFLGERIITTFGYREDKNFNKSGVTPPTLLPDGITPDYVWLNQWEGNWAARSGRTKTAGVVVKPLRWLHLHWNKSDAFKPAEPAKNLYGDMLPDPTGIGKDYGFSLNLFNDRLYVRFNKYETLQRNARNGPTSNFANSLRRVDIYDFSTSRPFGLDFRSRQWIEAEALSQGITLTEDQLNARVAEVMKMKWEDIVALGDYGITLSDVDNLRAKGAELEIHFNPTRYWTVKATGAQQIAYNGTVGPSVARYISERLPVWQSLIDSTTNEPWYTKVYGTGSTAESFLVNNVFTPLNLARQVEGKSRPQVRKYRFNVTTNFRLAGVTEHRILKNFNIGGSLRWEDKGAIGYRGVQQAPERITELDANRPIWDKAHYYADAFVGYRTRLFRDRVGATFQVNVRNLQESGGLRPIAAFPDGRFYAYRIIDPRQFIFTATFDL